MPKKFFNDSVNKLNDRKFIMYFITKGNKSLLKFKTLSTPMKNKSKRSNIRNLKLIFSFHIIAYDFFDFMIIEIKNPAVYSEA